ncbi:MAG: 4Fe-4S dicluster domain-containing protein [Balneolaceae bacterium]|nr:MAG: 4Fe-4S dicluster domain-containing protein [Balneolaceae bacterium]
MDVMRSRILKYSRVAISLLFLTATGFLFLDFTEALSAGLINGVTWIQFVPSLLKFLNVLGLLALGFLAVLIATLLFGRVYCSTVCPLGILQDVFSRVSRFYTTRIRRRRPRYRPSAPQNLLRYSLLGVTVAAFLLGSVFLLNLLDPFSVFGKIFAGLVRPVYYAGNNLLADVFQSFGNYRFYHVETRQMTVLPLIFPVFMLGLVGVLAFRRGRLYCNTVCPVGSLLGLVSKYAMFRIQIDESLCTRCAECSLNCKAECIDLKSNEIDFTRCVGCFNCLNVCSRQGIDYRNHWFPSDRKPAAASEPFICDAPEALPDGSDAKMGISGDCDVPVDTSEQGQTHPPGNTNPPENPNPPGKTHAASAQNGERRDFLFRLTAYFVGFSAASRALKSQAQEPGPDRRDDLDVEVTLPSTIPEKKNFPVSPPGSLSLQHFMDSCTACQLCVSACPTHVLQPSFLEYGFTGMMQPRLDFHASFCNFDCVRCTDVCPTGAILPLSMEQKHITQVGVVRLELDNCVVQTENTACGACAEHCPTQAVRMVPYQDGLTIPEIAVEHCIGCGACEYICPTRPYRAIYIDGNEVHAEAIPPIIEELDYTPDDDFPF